MKNVSLHGGWKLEKKIGKEKGRGAFCYLSYIHSVLYMMDIILELFAIPTKFVGLFTHSYLLCTDHTPIFFPLLTYTSMFLPPTLSYLHTLIPVHTHTFAYSHSCLYPLLFLDLLTHTCKPPIFIHPTLSYLNTPMLL